MLLLVCISAGVFAQDSPGKYTVRNVKVNTDYSDFGTAFYGDNQIVFAAPKFLPTDLLRYPMPRLDNGSKDPPWIDCPPLSRAASAGSPS